MPGGKAASVRCINLTEDYLCKIFNHPQRPKVCWNFNFDPVICGENREEAIGIMQTLE